jgi:hypothetical protein
LGAIFRRVFNKHAQRVTDRRLATRNVATIVKAAAAKLGGEASAFAGQSDRDGAEVVGWLERGVSHGIRKPPAVFAAGVSRIALPARAIGTGRKSSAGWSAA